MHNLDTYQSGTEAKNVIVTDDTLTVDLMDGRTISVPVAWFPKLKNATPEQRERWTISGGGWGIHWEDLDEDISTEGLLRGGRLEGNRYASPAEFEAAKKRFLENHRELNQILADR